MNRQVTNAGKHKSVKNVDLRFLASDLITDVHLAEYWHYFDFHTYLPVAARQVNMH